MTLNSIISKLGFFLYVPAGMSLSTIFISVLYGEMAATIIFSLMTIVCTIAAFLSKKVKSKHKHDYSIMDIMGLSTVGWLMIILICSIPFIYIAHDVSMIERYEVENFSQFENAFFESVSGLTSTGLTVSVDPPSLPRSLQWWRSMMEWIGGLGIIIFASFIIKRKFDIIEDKYNKKSMKGLPVINLKEHDIGKIYGGITLATFLAFLASGIPTWEAINHALTTVSTGGFSVTNNSMAHYGITIQIIATVVIILTSIDIDDLYEALVNRSWVRLRNLQIAFYFILLFLGLVLLYMFTDIDFMASAFQTVSALGTAGFSTINIAETGPFLLVVLTVLMFIGGCSTSTAGGLKIYRVVIVLKPLIRKLGIKATNGELKLYRPTKADKNIQKNIEVVFIFWIAYWIISSMLLVLLLYEDFSITQILFDSTSAIGSVGLSSGVVNNDLNLIAKYIFSFNMLAGRLEMIPLLWLTHHLAKVSFYQRFN